MADQNCVLSTNLIRFGPFALDVANRVLCRNGSPVRVREREIAILIYLASREGTFVPRDELISAIWAGSTVTDANVRVQMAALRRLLRMSGQGAFVDFAPGRGYRFLARPADDQSAVPPPDAPAEKLNSRPIASRTHNLPIRIKPLFGRVDDVSRLITHLPHHRLVTIVGPGGIGKTTLALAGAEALVDAYEDGVRLVDMAGLSDPRLISATVAMAVSTSLISTDPVDDLVKFLRDKQMLILIDNCEHMIEEIASIVEVIMTRTRDVRFLTTSREPLRAESEWLFRLGPLDVPPPNGDLSASESQTYAAVKLFVERVRLSDNEFGLSDADALAVADLCRRLDGNPLAVELAAARVGLFGVQGLSEQLADNFSTLTQGRRTALLRHQTLRATLDWSYDLLAQRERNLLARLAIFRGSFTLSTAQAISGLRADEVVDGLAELTSKSLLNVDATCHPAQYRMLFLTRDYALEKLKSGGEFDLVARRHALAYLSLLQSAGSEVSTGVSDAWIDDIRSALTWTLGETGDFEVGMELVTASFGTALRIASLHERGMLLDLAAARMEALGQRFPVFEMRMLIERISVLQFSENKEAEMTIIADKAMTLAAEIQRDLGDITPLLETLITQVSIYFGEANAPAMQRHIQTIRALPLTPEQRAATIIILERMEFQAEYYAGNLSAARKLIEKVLSYPTPLLRTRHFTIADFISPSITGRIFLSRIYWAQGFPDRASQTSAEVLELALSLNAMVQCYVLAISAIPIAIWRGNRAYAKELVRQLKLTSTASSLEYWQSWVPYYQIILNFDPGEFLPPEARDQVSASAVNALQLDHLPTFSLCLPDASIRRLEAGYSTWQAPEVWRRRGDQFFREGRLQEAQVFLKRALEIAKAQSAFSWELRAATSLAHLWQAEEKQFEAHGLLSDTLDRVTEGFTDSDVQLGHRLLEGLGKT